MFLMRMVPIVILLILIVVPLWLGFRKGGMLRDTNPKHWKLGFIYYNPDTPRLWVAKRGGTPMTLNFARPAAWLIAVTPLAVAIAGLILTRIHPLR